MALRRQQTQPLDLYPVEPRCIGWEQSLALAGHLYDRISKRPDFKVLQGRLPTSTASAACRTGRRSVRRSPGWTRCLTASTLWR
jgi:hypothetical protein